MNIQINQEALTGCDATSQPLLNYLNMNNNNDVPTNYRNNSRIKLCYINIQYQLSEFLKSALKAEKVKPDQLNLGILIFSLLLLR